MIGDPAEEKWRARVDEITEKIRAERGLKSDFEAIMVWIAETCGSPDLLEEMPSLSPDTAKLSWFFVLDEEDWKTPIAVPNSVAGSAAWAHWMQKHRHKRVVKSDNFGDVHVSTCFIGTDHLAGLEHMVPHPFETMIFGNAPASMTGWQWRYPNWEMAEAGHDDVVTELREAMGRP